MNISVAKNDPDIGKRLDLFLSIKLPQLSRSHIKKTIESNEVKLNGELCYKAGYKVRADDVISFPERDLLPAPTVTQLPKSTFDLEILFEDEDYLFINKPIGLIVHPTSIQQKDTLVNKLLDLNSDLPSTHMLRPGIVHRLDKDTSGVIVIAKTPKALWWLSQQFAERKVTKHYRSLGVNHDQNFRYKKGDIFLFEGFMRRSSKDRKQFAVEHLKNVSKPQGRFSKSQFMILDIEKLEDGSHLIYSDIYPMTGRTHQIRVHQKELGFTIIKDPIYMPTKQLKWSDNLLKLRTAKQRLYLHAYSIAFENYNGKTYAVTAPIPTEYTSLFNKI